MIKENDCPLISIIMPAYNASLTIDKAIHSVLNQVYENWELIIVNDGSQDDTLNVCRKYDDSRISVITKENGGLSSARNTGLACSRGKYICFVDSDDWIESEYLSLLYRSIWDNQSDLSVCGFILSHDNCEVNLCLQKNECYQYVYDNEDFIKIFEQGLLNSSCNKLYKKKIISDYHIQFETVTLVEDIAFNIQYFRYASKISFIKEPLYHYEQNNSNLTIRVSRDAFDNYLHIHSQLLELVDNKYRVLINRYVYHQYMSIVMKYLAKVAVGELSKEKVFVLLKSYMNNPLVIESFACYKPNTKKEWIIYELIKRHHFLFVMLYLRRKVR